jgi:thiamine kinase-like enzyme
MDRDSTTPGPDGRQPDAAPGRRAAPPASGVRIAWWDVPQAQRARVEDALGGRVVEAVTQAGGFSPGAAARLRLADGRRAFAKAVSAAQNPDAPAFHRREARIAAALPAEAPAPRLLAALDEDGWVVLVFEDVDGTAPAQPWRRDELRRAVAALADMARVLDPSPIDAPDIAESYDWMFKGWRRLAAARDAGADDLAGLDRWAARHLDRLARAEADWPAAAAGTGLVHGDARADNLLLTADRVVVVDWPAACVAAPWFDLVAMVPSVWMHSGRDLSREITEHPLVRDADPAAVTVLVIALTGFFLEQGRQPAPAGLPTLRAFQSAQGDAALAWLRERCAW